MKLTLFEVQFVKSFVHIENSLLLCLFLLEQLFFKFYWGIRTQQNFAFIHPGNCES